MLEAMAHAVAEKGYAATTVRDVIERAGVSRETYYEHFADKLDCFVAMLDHGTERMLATIDPGEDADREALDRFETVLKSYFAALAADPRFARAFLIEAFAAGPEAVRRRFAIQERFVALTTELFAAGNAEQRFACEMLVASISSLVTNRVAAGRADELPALRAPVMRQVRRSAPNAD